MCFTSPPPMNPAIVIAKKRDGLALSREEIGAFIEGFSRGEIPDYQMAALAMAIYLPRDDGGRDGGADGCDAGQWRAAAAEARAADSQGR